MNNQTIDEMQKELDELGNESNALNHENFEDNTQISEDGLFEDNTLDVNLDKSPKTEEPVEVPVKENIAKEKFQERFAKRNNKIKDLEDKVGGLQSSIDRIASLLEKGQGEAAKDKFDEYATKHNLDAVGIRELAGIIKEEVSGKVQSEEKVESAQVDDEDNFSTEWEEFLPEIEKDYPKMTASQAREVEKLMDEISHSSPRLANYELADIFNSPKYNQRFKDILFQGKKMFESGRSITKGSIEKPSFENMEINSVHDALAASNELFRMAEEQGQSPIHRAR